MGLTQDERALQLDIIRQAAAYREANGLGPRADVVLRSAHPLSPRLKLSLASRHVYVDAPRPLPGPGEVAPWDARTDAAPWEGRPDNP